MGELTIEIVRHMPPEEFYPHLNDVLACFEKYVDKFPHEETVEHMLEDICLGRRDLWLVKDETGKVILAPITEIITFSTGKKALLMAEVAGVRLKDSLHLLKEMEKWAIEQGIDYISFPARTGYRKLLGKYGYKEKIVTFTKELKSE